MEIETVGIGTIFEDPANVRRHPARSIESIKSSLVRFGQQSPIVVDAKGVIRKGNGTYAAAKELGWTEIDVVRTPLHGSEATAYSIADNRTQEHSDFDPDALASQLQALQDEDFDLAAVGYTDAEFDALMAGLTGTVPDSSGGDASPPDEFTSYDEDIETEYCCPKCSYSWSGKPK
jgi:ParB-like chromosome segregation protein Spo0J